MGNTGFGCTGPRVPLPSSPKVASPQQNMVPVVVVAQLCVAPAVILLKPCPVVPSVTSNGAPSTSTRPGALATRT